MNDELLIASVVVGISDSDAEELDELARSLRDELLASGVEDARPVSTGPAPPGTKAGPALQIGELLVTLAPIGLQGVIDAIRHWGSRRPVTKVSVTIGSNTLVLDNATAEQQEQVVQAFLAKQQHHMD